MDKYLNHLLSQPNNQTSSNNQPTLHYPTKLTSNQPFLQSTIQPITHVTTQPNQINYLIQPTIRINQSNHSSIQTQPNCSAKPFYQVNHSPTFNQSSNYSTNYSCNQITRLPIVNYSNSYSFNQSPIFNYSSKYLPSQPTHYSSILHKPLTH